MQVCNYLKNAVAYACSLFTREVLRCIWYAVAFSCIPLRAREFFFSLFYLLKRIECGLAGFYQRIRRTLLVQLNGHSKIFIDQFSVCQEQYSEHRSTCSLRTLRLTTTCSLTFVCSKPMIIQWCRIIVPLQCFVPSIVGLKSL